MDAEEFDTVEFEQKLGNLKDTQDSIQAMSAWCLKHRANHKKVVSSWLNVLKQVKVEHRLTLFHLANDVIQYSKRKNYEFVDSWGTTLQRATTMVRDEKVKNKIIRIFNIWEQRGIYNDEFLADLHGLLSINPTKKQQQVDSDDEQASILSSNIRNCVRLEKDTDKNFKILTKTPLCDTENYHTLKDRRHVEDVERDIEEHANKLENYIKCLNAEMKARTILIAVLEQTDAFYHNQRGEVKVVANAYRNFGNRIKSMKRKLDELVTKLPSPIPSPDINAPSPEPDNDLDLPDYDKGVFDQRFIDKKANGFLSCMDGGQLPFDINDFKSESPKNDAQPIQVIGSQIAKDSSEFNIDEFFKSIMPLDSGTYTQGVPQPVPPVVTEYSSTSAYRSILPQNQYGQNPSLPSTNQQYTPTPRMSNSHYGHSPNVPSYRPHHPPYNPTINNYMPPPPPRPRYPMNTNYNNHNVSMPPVAPVPVPFDGNLSDEYNPETWDAEIGWTSNVDDTFNPAMETPVSPPHFDQEGVSTDAIQYIDQSEGILTSATDVDHRQLRLPNIPMKPLVKEKGRALDVDHRNLISLTGSPGLKIDKDLPSLNNQLAGWKGDVDFRQTPKAPIITTSEPFGSYDSDYRIPPLAPSLHKINESADTNIQIQVLSVEERNLDSVEDDSGVFSSIAARTNDKNSNPFRMSQNIPGLTPPRDSNSPEVVEDEEVQYVEKIPVKGHHPKSGKAGQINDNVETIDMEMSDDEFVEFDDMFMEQKDGETSDAVTAINDSQPLKRKSLNLTKKPPPENQYSSNKFIQQQHMQPEQSYPEYSENDENKTDESTNHVNVTSQPPANIFQNQFRPPMFNSPPPNMNRPPLMNPNFSQNRFWGENMNTPPPGLNNQPFPHPWNTPPNIRRMNSPQNMNIPRHMRGMPHMPPFNTQRFGHFFPPPNNNNVPHQINRSFNPSQNISNLTAPKIAPNSLAPNQFDSNLDQDDRLQQGNSFNDESDWDVNDEQPSTIDENLSENHEKGSLNTDTADAIDDEQWNENDATDRDSVSANEMHTQLLIHEEDQINDDNEFEVECNESQNLNSLHDPSENDNNIIDTAVNSKGPENDNESNQALTPRKINPFSQPPRIPGSFVNNEECSPEMLNHLFHKNPDSFRNNPRNVGAMPGTRPLPLLFTPPGLLPQPNFGPLLRGPIRGGSPYFNRPNLPSNDISGRGHSTGFGGRGRGGIGGGLGPIRGPLLRGLSPANRRGINGGGSRGRSNGNFRGNFRGN